MSFINSLLNIIFVELSGSVGDTINMILDQSNNSYFQGLELIIGALFILEAYKEPARDPRRWPSRRGDIGKALVLPPSIFLHH